MNMWKIDGENIEDLFPEKGENYLLIGGIKKENVINDGKRKEIEIRNGNLRIYMRKGYGHEWTKFSEDCIMIYLKENFKSFAIFDGVSGNMDGGGGIASRKAGEILLKILKNSEINYENCKKIMENYVKICSKEIEKGHTTALILFLFRNKAILFNKGDSYCFFKGELINRLNEDEYGFITKVLNDFSEFDLYKFNAEKGEILMISDGYYVNEFDDVSIIEYFV